MANEQPVDHTLLKHPPEQESLARMREIANIFLEKLDRLTVIVASFHNQNPCPDAMEVIGLLRFGTAEQCMKLSEVISSVQKFTLTYLAFITLLSNKKERSVLKFSFKRVEDDAAAIAKLMDEARKMGHEFEKKVKEEELPRIMEAMKKNKNANKKVLTEKNLQVVTDFLNAAHEYGNLLKQNSEYFKEIARLVRDEKISPPSDQEIEGMREVWQAFTQKNAGLERGLEDIEDGIWEGKKIRDNTDPFNPFHTKSKNSKDASNNHKDPDGSSNSSRSSSFRKSVSQRLFSFLNRGHS